MKKQTHLEYSTPFIEVNEVEFERGLCQSRLKASITVEELEEVNNPDHDLEF